MSYWRRFLVTHQYQSDIDSRVLVFNLSSLGGNLIIWAFTSTYLPGALWCAIVESPSKGTSGTRNKVGCSILYTEDRFHCPSLFFHSSLPVGSGERNAGAESLPRSLAESRLILEDPRNRLNRVTRNRPGKWTTLWNLEAQVLDQVVSVFLASSKFTRAPTRISAAVNCVPDLIHLELVVVCSKRALRFTEHSLFLVFFPVFCEVPFILETLEELGAPRQVRDYDAWRTENFTFNQLTGIPTVKQKATVVKVSLHFASNWTESFYRFHPSSADTRVPSWPEHSSACEEIV